MAGGKRRSIGRKDNCTNARFMSNFRERVAECSEERLRQTVARFGPVERQDCDVPGVFAQKDRRRSRCNAGGRGLSVARFGIMSLRDHDLVIVSEKAGACESPIAN